MNRRKWVGIALVVLALAAALPVLAGDKYVIEEGKPLDVNLRPAPGKALVVFVRSQVMGAAIKVKLYADGKFQGLVMAHTYLAYECEPGAHEFIAAAENAGFLRAQLEADRVYVVQVAIHMGALKARTHFETARKGSEALDEVTKNLAKLRAITTTPEGVAWANEKDEDFQKTIARFRAKGEEFEDLKPEDGAPALPWAK